MLLDKAKSMKRQHGDDGGGAPACGTSGAALQPGASPPSAWEKQLLQAQGLFLSCVRDEGTPADGTVCLPGAAAPWRVWPLVTRV